MLFDFQKKRIHVVHSIFLVNFKCHAILKQHSMVDSPAPINWQIASSPSFKWFHTQQTFFLSSCQMNHKKLIKYSKCHIKRKLVMYSSLFFKLYCYDSKTDAKIHGIKVKLLNGVPRLSQDCRYITSIIFLFFIFIVFFLDLKFTSINTPVCS